MDTSASVGDSPGFPQTHINYTYDTTSETVTRTIPETEGATLAYEKNKLENDYSTINEIKRKSEQQGKGEQEGTSEQQCVYGNVSRAFIA